jgi:hypothetical protein
MQFETSERIDTTASRDQVMTLASQQFKKVASRVESEVDLQFLIVTGVEETFGSINRTDRTKVDCKQLPSGWLLTAEVSYKPSFAFWIILIITLFSYVGWIIPIGLYLIQRNTVKSGVAAVLSRVGNELRVAPTAMPAAQASSVDDLTKLADLKERGFLTADEFEAKKRQILGR